VPHCSAIAAAGPGYVTALAARLSSGSLVGPRRFCPESVWFPHRFFTVDYSGGKYVVGNSTGRLMSHRQVSLLASSPNSYGWIIWSGLRHRVLMMQTGFSMQTLPPYSVQIMKSETACSRSATLRWPGLPVPVLAAHAKEPANGVQE